MPRLATTAASDVATSRKRDGGLDSSLNPHGAALTAVPTPLMASPMADRVAVCRSRSQTIVPSYIATMRSLSSKISARSSEIEQDRTTIPALAHELGVNEGGGADIQPARRLGNDQHAGRERKLARNQRLLLIAAGEDRRADRDRVAAHHRPPSRGPRNPGRGGDRAIRSARRAAMKSATARGSRPPTAPRQSGAEPVLGDVGQSGGLKLRGPKLLCRSIIEENFSTPRTAETGDRLLQAPLVHCRKRRPHRRFHPSGPPGRRPGIALRGARGKHDALELQALLTDLRWRRCAGLEFMPAHQPCQSGIGERGVGLCRAHNGAAANHHHPVGDRADLIQLVTDENDADAVGLQGVDRRKQAIGLDRCQDRCGLVENQDPRIAKQRLDDFEALLLACCEARGKPILIEMQPIGAPDPLQLL